ncbi:RsmE family RNA methyltransferase [candidate division KSB1 bacterium]
MQLSTHNYFYIDPENVSRDFFIITEDDFHHAARVLRLMAGSVITAVDGIGNEYIGEIQKIVRNKEAKCLIVKKRRKPNEPLLDITLIQAVIKGDRFESLVEKAVELGVNRIIPVHTKRCVVTADTKKINRWRRKAISAMKQSCRSVLPEITPVSDLNEALELTSNISLKMILSQDVENTISQVIRKYMIERSTRSAAVLIGPEGDFTEEETAQAKKQFFEPVSMGQRRLRSETAGIAVLSALLAFDD